MRESKIYRHTFITGHHIVSLIIRRGEKKSSNVRLALRLGAGYWRGEARGFSDTGVAAGAKSIPGVVRLNHLKTAGSVAARDPEATDDVMGAVGDDAGRDDSLVAGIPYSHPAGPSCWELGRAAAGGKTAGQVRHRYTVDRHRGIAGSP